MDDEASLLPLYLEGDALTFYMEMEEDNQKQIKRIEAGLKEAFTDNVLTVYRKVTMIRWAGKRVDVYAIKIRQLVGLARFKGDGLERLTKLAFVTGFNRTSTGTKRQSPDHGSSDSKSESADDD